MKTALSTNGKTGHSINFNPLDTCGPCPLAKVCYGKKNRNLFSNTIAANHARLDCYLRAPEVYFAQLERECSGKKYIRVNGNGDTPDKAWALLFCNMALRLPDTHFWVATRKNFWRGIALPKNVLVRYSHGLEGDYTSSVTKQIGECTCPATLPKEQRNIHTCKECGYLCWSKAVRHVTYMLH